MLDESSGGESMFKPEVYKEMTKEGQKMALSDLRELRVRRGEALSECIGRKDDIYEEICEIEDRISLLKKGIWG